MSRSDGGVQRTITRPFSVRLKFEGDLPFFLRRSSREPFIERILTERTSVKDVIESCGVPHTEVDWILADGAAVKFSYVLHQNTHVTVYPVGAANMAQPEHRLQRVGLTRFVADGHLGKLTRNLRLLGFDVAAPGTADDEELLEIMQRENRALLTRDRHLLMHAVVRDGFCPRSQEPNGQTVEVLRRFEVFSAMAPFTRCLRCNGSLAPVDKATVIESLEPLTRIYYERFWRCDICGQIYWPGTHLEKLRTRVEELRAKFG